MVVFSEMYRQYCIVLNANNVKNAIYKFPKYGNAHFVARFKCLICGAVHVLHACYTRVTLQLQIELSGVASVNNWRGEYSYICVHRP